jgi:hypothetical protein
MPQAATGVELEFRLSTDFIEIVGLLSTSIEFLPVHASALFRRPDPDLPASGADARKIVCASTTGSVIMP